MKRLLCFVLAFCMAAVLFVGCADTNTDNSQNASTPEGTSSSTESSSSSTESSSSSATESSSETEESSVTEAPMEQPEAIPQSIKILAIGNSFSEDATQYLWDIMHDAGIEEVVIGNLYIGGCSLDTHWSNMTKNAEAYTFYYNNSGKWETNKSKSILHALQLEDWDYITVQQVSQDSGNPKTLGNLQNILDYVNKNKTNAEAKVYWHMTWAYQFNASHEGFANYGRSQMNMYNAIVSTYTDHVAKYEMISGAIPTGTAVQNLRTSYLDDSLNRDGYHMDNDIGRYTVALTWFSFFTGIDARYINWVPEEFPQIAADKAAVCHAVNNAIAKPFEITPSIYTKKAIPTEEMTDADKQNLTALGYDPDKYYVLDLDMEAAALYVCTGHGKKLTPALVPSNKKVPLSAASGIFTRDQIPVGSVITVAPGYEYSPEAWMSYGQRTPQNLAPAKTSAVTVVDEAWWGVFQYRAFNLNSLTANTVMQDSDLDKLRVYVPKKAPKLEKYSELTQDDISILTAAGKNASDYQALNLEMMLASFYKSTNSATRFYGITYSHTDFPKWMASKVFEKADLPNGTVISLKSGYEYRPEGWIDLNTPVAARQDVTTAATVVVDDAWWGSFNYRAFNVSVQGEASFLSYSDINALRIYVPKN